MGRGVGERKGKDRTGEERRRERNRRAAKVSRGNRQIASEKQKNSQRMHRKEENL